MTANRLTHDVPTRPRLRSGLAAVEDAQQAGRFILHDPLRIAQPLWLNRVEIACVPLFNGQRDLRTVQLDLVRQLGGTLVPLELIHSLACRLDEGLFLNSPRLTEYLDGPIREPSCIGCYSGDPDELRHEIDALFTAPGGPGLPAGIGVRADQGSRLRAVLVPHMDFTRGGVTYGWGFRELAEASDATLFVIIATSHYSFARFSLTRKHFKTPFGIIQTDQEYVDRLVGHYGDGLFDDPMAHLPEHSIELEVVMMQHMFAGHREFRIVPLLVGSFRDCVEEGAEPTEYEDIGRMLAALRRCEAETNERICYVISGDLAHIGPKFDDPEPVNEPWLRQSRERDTRILDQVNRADASGYFRVIAEEDDARRICGLPPTYTTLASIQPKQGKLLHYGRFVDPTGYESVSFASASFYESD